jgi:hypothetical protein
MAASTGFDVESLLEGLLSPLFGSRPVWTSRGGVRYRETSWYPVGRIEVVELTKISGQRGPNKVTVPRAQLVQFWEKSG